MKKSLLMAVLALALLLSAAAYATATSQTYGGVGSPSSANGSVTVTATVNPLINLTIVAPDATQTVNFGLVNPGVLVAGKTVNVTVDSNRTFALTKTITGKFAELGLATSLLPSVANPKGSGTAFVDNYSITPPFSTDPGVYNAFVQYTVTQP